MKLLFFIFLCFLNSIIKLKIEVPKMNIMLSDYISWQYCLIVLVILFFLIWLFFGGKDGLQYVGLSPLKIGVDATRNVEHNEQEDDEKEKEENVEEIEYDEEPVDRTPTLPDVLRKQEENDFFQFTHSKCEAPIISVSESYEQSPINGDAQAYIELQSPKSAALGQYQCYKNEKLSKGEMLCKKAIEDIYGLPFYCVRPDFLKNPETGRNLELDLYNDKLKLAIERNGEHHYKYPNTFHKTKEEFINQVRRDQYKVEMCDQQGIYLISVPYNVPNSYPAIRKYIELFLPENIHKRNLSNST